MSSFSWMKLQPSFNAMSSLCSEAVIEVYSSVEPQFNIEIQHNVDLEIYYNIVEEPANYLSYYVGYLQFLDLRDQAENSWGNSFTAKEFHQKILDIGPATFDVIESYLFRTQ